MGKLFRPLTRPITGPLIVPVKAQDLYPHPRGASPRIQLSANTIPEDAEVDDPVGTASVSGSYTGTPAYSLADDAGGKFKIDSSTGVVSVDDALDYETATSHGIEIEV